MLYRLDASFDARAEVEKRAYHIRQTYTWREREEMYDQEIPEKTEVGYELRAGEIKG